MEGFADAEAPLYTDLFRNRPPFTTHLVLAGDWWGCHHWLVKGEPVAGYPVQTIDPPAFIAEATDALSTSVPAKLTPARFTKEMALVYVGSATADHWTVDPLYLHYVEAFAEIEMWRWAEGFGSQRDQHGAKRPDAGMLLGVSQGELVGLIAPRQADEPLARCPECGEVPAVDGGRCWKCRGESRQ